MQTGPECRLINSTSAETGRALSTVADGAGAIGARPTRGAFSARLVAKKHVHVNSIFPAGIEKRPPPLRRLKPALLSYWIICLFFYAHFVLQIGRFALWYAPSSNCVI